MKTHLRQHGPVKTFVNCLHYQLQIKFFTNFLPTFRLKNNCKSKQSALTLVFTFACSCYFDVRWLIHVPSPMDTVRKLNVHKTFRRSLGHLNVLCMFYLLPLSHHVKQNILTTIKIRKTNRNRSEQLTEIDLLIRNSAKKNSQ